MEAVSSGSFLQMSTSRSLALPSALPLQLFASLWNALVALRATTQKYSRVFRTIFSWDFLHFSNQATSRTNILVLRFLYSWIFLFWRFLGTNRLLFVNFPLLAFPWYEPLQFIQPVFRTLFRLTFYMVYCLNPTVFYPQLP